MVNYFYLLLTGLISWLLAIYMLAHSHVVNAMYMLSICNVYFNPSVRFGIHNISPT